MRQVVEKTVPGLALRLVIASLICATLWGAVPRASAAAATSSPSAVIASAGSYQLTEEMIQQALRLAQFLAAADFSPADAAALRTDLIAVFHAEPAKQIQAYESVANNFRTAAGLAHNPTSLAVANDRYKMWQWYGENPEGFREFQSYPFGKMVLKYNPVLVNSGGIVVTRADVDCQFYANTLVAQAAGVAPPTQAEKERFVRNLPAQFASWPPEQRDYLRRAEIRLASLRLVYEGTIKTRAAVLADVKSSVHSAADVSGEARQVENDAQYTGKYYQLYRSEVMGALFNAGRVNRAVTGLGAAGRSTARSSDINTPVGTR